MTWVGRCTKCGYDLCTLTVSSTGAILVNCADDDCQGYIGTIPAEHVGQISPGIPTVYAEPH